MPAGPWVQVALGPAAPSLPLAGLQHRRCHVKGAQDYSFCKVAQVRCTQTLRGGQTATPKMELTPSLSFTPWKGDTTVCHTQHLRTTSGVAQSLAAPALQPPAGAQPPTSSPAPPSLRSVSRKQQPPGHVSTVHPHCHSPHWALYLSLWCACHVGTPSACPTWAHKGSPKLR